MDTSGNLAWITAGGGQELYNELMSPHKVVCLPCGATGFQMGGWYNREIKSTKDLEGLKIRIPGLAASVLSEAGAKPVLLPGGEVFTGLSTGVIDAVEWVGPYHDYVMGFHKAAKYYYGSSWHEPGPLLELMINEASWKSLSPTTQMAVTVAASDTSSWMQAQWNAKNSEYLKKLQSDGKIIIRPLPDEVLRHLKTISEKVKKELAKTSPLANKIYESYTKFQSEYEAYQTLAGRYQPL